jgi:hypothetical protein
MSSNGIQKYVDQLEEDLLDRVSNPPSEPYIEPPLHLGHDPVVSELALVPFKTIEEWTAIKQELFPESIDLTACQCAQLNEAILKIFDSLNLEPIDIPVDIPPEYLYEVFTMNWDLPVQYLPASGMDLEYCTGDPKDCPYGEFCDCQSQ